MLLGQQFRWRHDHCLVTSAHGMQSGRRGYDCLAAAHITLQKSHHRMSFMEVLSDDIEGFLLIACQLKCEAADKSFDQIILWLQCGQPSVAACACGFSADSGGGRAILPAPVVAGMGENLRLVHPASHREAAGAGKAQAASSVGMPRLAVSSSGSQSRN